ncbi:MAG: hypothetical protein WDO24_29255 [Pseudomonadota bacterium]
MRPVDRELLEPDCRLAAGQAHAEQCCGHVFVDQFGDQGRQTRERHRQHPADHADISDLAASSRRATLARRVDPPAVNGSKPVSSRPRTASQMNFDKSVFLASGATCACT